MNEPTFEKYWKQEKNKKTFCLTRSKFIKFFSILVEQDQFLWSKLKGVKKIDQGVFYKNYFLKQKNTIKKPKKNQKKTPVFSSVLPSSLEHIANSAFQDCRFKNDFLDLSKTKIKIINANAFKGCNLKKLLLPKVDSLILNANCFSNNPLKKLDISHIKNLKTKKNGFAKTKLTPNSIKKRKGQLIDFLNYKEKTKDKQEQLHINKIKTQNKNNKIKIEKLQKTIQEIRKEKNELRKLNKSIENKKNISENKNKLKINLLEVKINDLKREIRKQKTKLKTNQKSILSLKNKTTLPKKSKTQLDQNNQINIKKIKELEQKLNVIKGNAHIDVTKLRTQLSKVLNEIDIEEIGSILIDGVVSNFFFLIKSIDSIFLPYLIKFENRIKFLFKDFFIFSKQDNTDIQLKDISEEIYKSKDKVINYLNLNANKKFKNTLVKLNNVFNSKDKESDWNQNNITSLYVVVNCLRLIRNRVIHTDDQKSSEFIQKFNNKISFSHHYKDCKDVFLKAGLSSLGKGRKFEKYPMLIIGLSFFNERYVIDKILSEVYYNIHIYCSYADFRLFKPEKVFDLLGLNENNNEMINDTLKKLIK